MSTNKGILVYNEKPINFRDEMLCLTDMWKAAGKPASSSPAEWQRSADAEKFIEFISETQNMGISHVIKSNPGKGGGTWAYWQIAFAYAKKLSPEFHAWVNQAAREKMEALAGKQKEKTVKRTRKPAFDVAFERCLRVASHLSHLDENQRLLSAARGTKELSGVNPLELMGITSIAAPTQDNYLTPTQIGKEIGLSPIATNRLIIATGHQVKSDGSSTSSDYTMTEAGMKYGRMFDTTRKHGKGSQQQLKWSPDLVGILRTAMIAGEGKPVPFAKKRETATV